MAKKEELDKDFENFNLDIERFAEKGINEIHQKADAVREDAIKIGAAVELSLNDSDGKAESKKKS